MTADRCPVGLVYAALGYAARGGFFYGWWTTSRWLPWLMEAAAAIMVSVAGLSMAVRTCR